MTSEEFDEVLERTNAVVCNREWCERAIKALVMVEEFEKAHIITGGRLNGRTYAYKCGLEDGKRKALEQEEYYKDLAQSYEKTIVKLTEAIAEQQPSDDCVSRQKVITIIQNHWWNCKDIDELVKALPQVTPTRKKGKWIEEPNCWLRCSCCNSHHPHTSIYTIRGSNYCPNCGAEMEVEE